MAFQDVKLTNGIYMRRYESHGSHIKDSLGHAIATLMRDTHEWSDTKVECLHAQVACLFDGNSTMFQVDEKRILAGNLG